MESRSRAGLEASRPLISFRDGALGAGPDPALPGVPAAAGQPSALRVWRKGDRKGPRAGSAERTGMKPTPPARRATHCRQQTGESPLTADGQQGAGGKGKERLRKQSAEASVLRKPWSHQGHTHTDTHTHRYTQTHTDTTEIHTHTDTHRHTHSAMARRPGRPTSAEEGPRENRQELPRLALPHSPAC